LENHGAPLKFLFRKGIIMPFQLLMNLFTLGFMRKIPFVHTWGRKLFFGTGLVSAGLVGLNYFQSMIWPQSIDGWLFLITSFVGHYGLLISLLYFLFFCPVTYFFPTYYVSRIWSGILLVGLNSFIFFDSYFFSKYRFHANSFLGNFLVNDRSVFGFSTIHWVLFVTGIFVFFIVLWIRGERIWRQMQARFSNPVSNWYLVVIGVCLIMGHMMYLYSDSKGGNTYKRLSQLLPLYYLTSQDEVPYQRSLEKVGHKDFYYPKNKLNCIVKKPKNILMIVIDYFENFSNYPRLSHYKKHGVLFSKHYSGGYGADEGLFSLLYSMPPIYMTSAYHTDQKPVFSSLLESSGYEMSYYSSRQDGPVESWMNVTEKELHLIPFKLKNDGDQNPFFIHAYLSGSAMDNDNHVGDILEATRIGGHLPNTIIFITGASGLKSGGGPLGLKTPLLVFWPDEEAREVDYETSHYDIVPSVMQDELGCRNIVSDYSFGENMFRPNNREVHMAGTYRALSIIDFKNSSFASIEEQDGLKLKVSPAGNQFRVKELLKVLERSTLFYRLR
jgi:uncharacterized protein